MMKRMILPLALLAATTGWAMDVTALRDARIEAKGGETVQYAASELARLLGRIGVKATVRVTGADGNSVSLGAPKAADVSGVRHDGFTIACAADGVTIAATCGKGVLNGVYQLAEDLGFGFVLPTPQGELVPEKPAALAEGVRTVNPRFAYRGLYSASDMVILYDQQAWYEFLAKLRFNATCNHCSRTPEAHALYAKLGFRKETGGHEMSACLPRDLYKERPELFRMFQPEDFSGKRLPDSNFCASNPKTRELFAANYLKRVTPSATLGYYAHHAWADDLPAGGWCLCSRCRAYAPTDQSQMAMNTEARAIRRAGLKLRVPALAYHDTLFPSELVEPDPLCFLLYAPRERCYAHALDDPRCTRNAGHLKGLEAWARRYAKNDDAHTFEYYTDQMLFRGHTPYLPETLLGDADVYERCRIESFMSLQIGGPLLSPDWNLLAFSRVAWEKGLDRDRLTAKVLQGVPAADRAAWTKYLDLRAAAYEHALAICDCPNTIYMDYRFMPERSGEAGRKLIDNLVRGAKLLAEARAALAGASLTPSSVYVQDLELKYLVHQCTDLLAMAEHQRGLYEIACWHDDDDKAHLKKAVDHLQRTLTLLEQACAEFRPLVLRPDQSDYEGGFCLCYYLYFISGWSMDEIRNKIAIYAPERPAQEKPVKIMSYNIRHGAGLDGKLNPERQMKIIAAEKPDFVGLQEVDVNTKRTHGLDSREAYARGTGMTATFAKAIDCEGGDYGVMVLSKQKPLSVERIPLPGGEPRVLLVCEFPDCYFATTHFCCSTNPTDRLTSVEIIRRTLSRLSPLKPFYLTGDWNDVADSRTLGAMSRFMKILSVRDCQTYHGSPQFDAKGRPYDMKRFCIDYIAVDKLHADVRRVGDARLIEAREASDHVPTLVNLVK